MVTAMSIAGDLSFNPETDTLTGANGRLTCTCTCTLDLFEAICGTTYARIK